MSCSSCGRCLSPRSGGRAAAAGSRRAVILDASQPSAISSEAPPPLASPLLILSISPLVSLHLPHSLPPLPSSLSLSLYVLPSQGAEAQFSHDAAREQFDKRLDGDDDACHMMRQAMGWRPVARFQRSPAFKSGLQEHRKSAPAYHSWILSLYSKHFRICTSSCAVA